MSKVKKINKTRKNKILSNTSLSVSHDNIDHSENDKSNIKEEIQIHDETNNKKKTIDITVLNKSFDQNDNKSYATSSIEQTTNHNSSINRTAYKINDMSNDVVINVSVKSAKTPYMNVVKKHPNTSKDNDSNHKDNSAEVEDFTKIAKDKDKIIFTEERHIDYNEANDETTSTTLIDRLKKIFCCL